MLNINSGKYKFSFDFSDKNSFPRIRKQKYEISANALSSLKINESNGFVVITEDKHYFIQIENKKLKWLEISNFDYSNDKYIAVFADGCGYKANYNMHIYISNHLYPSDNEYWYVKHIVFFHDTRDNVKYIQYFNRHMTAEFDSNDVLVNIYDDNVIYRR